MFALERTSGRLRWARLYSAPNDGPNGAAVVGDRVVAATDTTVFALNRANGRRVWSRRLTDRDEQFVDIAPVVDRGRVYVSTVGVPARRPGRDLRARPRHGSGALKFETIAQPWPTAQAGAAERGARVGRRRRSRLRRHLEPRPVGRLEGAPQRRRLSRAAALYTDSLVVLDGATGRLLWHDQVVPHDVRDYDFHVTPILARAGGRELVFGGGKGRSRRRVGQGRRAGASGRARWGRTSTTSGRCHAGRPRVPRSLRRRAHSHGARSRAALRPRRRAVHDRERSAFGIAPSGRPEKGRGVLMALEAATGRRLWQRALGSAPFACATVSRDVVFVPTFDGRIHALAARTGHELWSDRAPAGINGCPSVSGDTRFVPAGAPHNDFEKLEPQLLAYRLNPSPTMNRSGAHGKDVRVHP